MPEITKESLEETLRSLIEANAHARSKGDDFKNWCSKNFHRDARISYIKAQQQLTNRVSEQFRYFSPIVLFVCVSEVNRDTLLRYIMERTYSEMENVAVVGLTQTSPGVYSYRYEYLVVVKQTDFTKWATPFFEKVKSAKELRTEFGLPGELDFAWYVGTTGGTSEGERHDYSDEFITKGIWTNFWDTKYIDLVREIKVGDRIAIKSTFSQKRDVPFDNNGKTVAVMRIKAIGTVTENSGDGKSIRVDWKRLEPEKDWFGPGNLRQTIHGVSADDGEIKKQLLGFTFGEAIQDYSLCEEYYSVETEEDEPKSIDDEKQNTSILNTVSCLDISRLPIADRVHPFNFIVYGAPGTGKTYSMVEYALSIIDNVKIEEFQKTNPNRKSNVARYKDLVKAGRIVFTTFHQNYGYEEFIQGLRPDKDSETVKFKTVDGVFKTIADTAIQHKNDERFVIIIDEINRANISKVFGELITLIETDKRWGEENETSAVLQSGDHFAVPNNLYIVGTMNSADKSISLIDAALRRRFDFIEQKPNAELISNPLLKKVLQELNKCLVKDLESTDLLVGHSYFMGKRESDLCDILNNNIIPLLYEYYYDIRKKVYTTLKTIIKESEAHIEIIDDSEAEFGRIRVKDV